MITDDICEFMMLFLKVFQVPTSAVESILTSFVWALDFEYCVSHHNKILALGETIKCGLDEPKLPCHHGSVSAVAITRDS